MSDEESVSSEVQASTEVAPSTETESATGVEQPVVKQDNANERNWAEARRSMKERDRKIQELESRLELVQKAQIPKEPELNLADEDIVTYGQVKRLIQRDAAALADRVVRDRENATVDERLESKYSDFKDVVSKENIELLKQTEPELAKSLSLLKDDPMEQGVAAYKLLKKLGMGIKAEEDMPEKKKAIENGKKPVSVQSVTRQSAIGNAHLFENGLTPELKAALQKEMKEAIKRS